MYALSRCTGRCVAGRASGFPREWHLRRLAVQRSPKCAIPDYRIWWRRSPLNGRHVMPDYDGAGLWLCSDRGMWNRIPGNTRSQRIPFRQCVRAWCVIACNVVHARVQLSDECSATRTRMGSEPRLRKGVRCCVCDSESA